MTRKDYIMLASVIRESTTFVSAHGEALVSKDDLLRGLCSALKQDNVQFDCDKFRDAAYK